MRYAISDIEGETLATHHDQRSAVVAVFGMIDRGESPASALFLLAYGDDGEPVGEAVRGDDLLALRVRSRASTDTSRPASVYISAPADVRAEVEARPPQATDPVRV